MIRMASFWWLACVLPALAQQDGFVFKSDVRLVEVYASVFDQKGRYLDGLTRDRFSLDDNGMAQPIVAFEGETREVSCAILLDTTGSMARSLPAVKNAIVHLIDEMRDNDSVAAYGFDTSVTQLQDFTRDKHAVKQAVLRTRAGGTTALFDAIAQVAAEISTRSGKKALIVFTDGDDNASMLNLQAAMTRAKKVGIPIYSVAQGEALTSGGLIRQLRSISGFTNGLAYEVRKPHEVEAVFQDISADLQHTYMLAYKAPSAAEKKWRSIRVSINGAKEYKVRAREGYLPD
jgi:Ca-activated chloride channel homolog